MIITERAIINGREFIHTYSDDGFQIRKIGTDEIYSDAIDPIGVYRIYEETNIPIEKLEE